MNTTRLLAPLPRFLLLTDRHELGFFTGGFAMQRRDEPGSNAAPWKKNGCGSFRLSRISPQSERWGINE